jgi:hypothetical protein
VPVVAAAGNRASGGGGEKMRGSAVGDVGPATPPPLAAAPVGIRPRLR